MSDALAYADQTVGARGEPLPIADRLADMLRRRGPDSPNAAVHRFRAPYLLAIADGVEARLRAGEHPPADRSDKVDPPRRDPGHGWSG
ncbi:MULTISPECIES: hypothetical protein [unclassified Kribbella]|uniref:hypothetical protein n=1 Tax=unclassified Kribbella TaxID=2644121 RepID=UPI003016AEA4